MFTFTEVAAVAAQPMGFGGPHDGGGPPFPFLLIPLFWLLLLGGIAVAVVLGRRRREGLAGEMAGQQALAERFAAGDIDDDEYRSRLAVLREKR